VLPSKCEAVLASCARECWPGPVVGLPPAEINREAIGHDADPQLLFPLALARLRWQVEPGPGTNEAVQVDDQLDIAAAVIDDLCN
jgi:hypothetical protein